MNTSKLSIFVLILLSLVCCENEEPPKAAKTPELESLLTWLHSIEPKRYGSLTLADLSSLHNIRLDGSERPGQIDPLADESKLQELSKLPALRSLAIWTTSLSNTGLAIMGGFGSLENLEIGGWDVRYDDQGLSSLKNLGRLKRLKLTQAQGITDWGMRVVSELPALTDLDITYTKITDKGLAILAKSKSLEVVSYGWTAESKRWLAAFKNSGIAYNFELK